MFTVKSTWEKKYIDNRGRVQGMFYGPRGGWVRLFGIYSDEHKGWLSLDGYTPYMLPKKSVMQKVLDGIDPKNFVFMKEA